MQAIYIAKVGSVAQLVEHLPTTKYAAWVLGYNPGQEEWDENSILSLVLYH